MKIVLEASLASVAAIVMYFASSKLERLDGSKDQSYVLYSINREYLKNIFFPLGT
jgi:tRNA U34 2-thiouridine synthase MnmA/TrmU